MAKTAILYARVSTDEQADEGYGLTEQMRELRGHAEREGLSVIEEIVDDGYSGASRSRPGLTRIREIVEARDVDLIIATKWDRFFRRASYQEVL